jgi:hypothetical protein
MTIAEDWLRIAYSPERIRAGEALVEFMSSALERNAERMGLVIDPNPFLGPLSTAPVPTAMNRRERRAAAASGRKR